MIAIVDSGLATTNLGDHIISSAVHRQLIAPLEESGRATVTIPMHGGLTAQSRALLSEADQVIVCGTNLLSDHMRFRRSWQWSRSDIELTAGKLTMFGVGWWQYQRTGIDPVSASWMRYLAGPHPWAVRDEYSSKRLTAAGVSSVHVSCPTLWDCSQQLTPRGGGRVVTTLTDYNQDRRADERLVELLNGRFAEVLYWPQGPGDRAYIESLRGSASGVILEPTVSAFNAELRRPGTEYLGLRLHAGIRAIQMGVPTLILGIDNRATEISRSVGLGVISRHALNQIGSALDAPRVINLALPRPEIDAWLASWTKAGV